MKFKILPRNLRKQTNNILNKNERLATNLVDDKPSSIFDKSFRHLTTFNSGYLTPIFVDEVYPGDIMKIDTSTLIRLSTPAAATMENPIYDIAFYFVPYRILWENFKTLMGENKSAGYQKTIIRAPIIKYDIAFNGYKEDDLASYLGFPQSVDFSKTNVPINALWFKAYGKVWNDYYRDQNLQSEIDITNNNNNDDDVTYSSYQNSEYNKSIQVGKKLAPVSRLADYFSTCLPWAQKGEPVTIDTLPLKNLQINLSRNLPVKNANVEGSTDGFSSPLIYYDVGGNKYKDFNNDGPYLKSETTTSKFITLTNKLDGNTIYSKMYAPASDWKDIGEITSKTGYTYSINDLRLSLAFQHMLELDARGGTRYTEYLLNHFGIQATDARLDRAEYIGGFRNNINISNVVQSSTGPSSSPLGVLGGVSVSSAISPRPVNYAATEHGIIMGFIIVRPQVNYSQGLDKKFTRVEKFDYYDPLLANIGEQPVFKYELFLSDATSDNTNNTIFGYNEAWADLRYSNNKMSGYMSVNSSLSLASLYSYTEKYANAPTLNPEWMISDPNIIGRTLLLNNEKNEYIHQFLGDFYFSYTATRKMPVFSIPGLRKV